jgi:hypothetical protein
VSVTQVHEALGSFEFELLGNVPREVLDGIDHFDHIAVIPGRIDPRQYGDGCLTAARYVGVVRRKKIADDGRTNLIQDDIRISGVGMEFWLGDDEGKGAVIESFLDFTAANFTTIMNTLRPTAVGAGTIYSVSGTYSGRHVYETPRNAIQYVCETMSTSLIPVGYKVSNDAKLYAGPESDLFVTTPTCIVMRKGSTQGEDLFLRALPSTVDMDIDMEDFTTRVVMLAESDGESLATGTADVATVAPGVNVYKDLYGNSLALTRLVNESDTLEENADTRAELALRTTLNPHRTLTISTDDFDIHGSFEVGDYIYVYDPDSGLFDVANEAYIRGVRINPIKLRVTEMDFPITEGYTVAHRDKNGTWTDLSDYVHWEETQPSQVVIGDFNRDLTGADNTISTRTGAAVPADTSIPAAPAWVTASFQTTNYVDSQGNPKARQKLVWTTPLNTNASVITDGDRYEIQYKLDSGSQYSQTWAAASTLTWDALNTWEQPVEPDDTPWQTLVIGWGENTTVIHELPVGTGFDSRIRAVDKSNNQSDWSSTSTWITSEDNIPPSPPAAPVVAGSPIAIQVVHELGMQSGGTFNLENDLAYLEVHYSSDENFFPTETSLAGRLRADKGMMSANNAAVGTFTIPETHEVYVKVVAVDTGGNRSSASPPAPVTAELIDSAYISELTASKITAGTLSAVVILSGSIKTAEDGQRMELSGNGLQAYDPNGDLTINLTAVPSGGGDYLTLNGADGTAVANISSDGDASFRNVYANEALFIAGQDILTSIEALPWGVLAWGPVNAGNVATSTEIGLHELAFDAVEGRCYKFTVHPFLVAGNTDNMTVGIRMRDGGESVPTVSSSIVGYKYMKFAGTAQFTTLDWSRVMRCGVGMELEPGRHRFLTCLYSSGGTSTVYDGGSANYVYVSLEDVGTNPADTGYANDGGGTSTDPTQSYTKTYYSTWTRSYQGDGSSRISNGDIYQGYYSSTNGNQRSLIGFDYSTIQSDLAGATITSVSLTMDNTHFYNNSGGTAVIGTHDYTSSPSTWSGSRVVESITNFSWAKGAKKAVALSVSNFGNTLKSGDATGIALGPGDSTSLTYYGYFVGQNGGTNRPSLTIKYTK